MTIRTLLKKYQELQDSGYETVFITQVAADLRQIVRDLDFRKTQREIEKERGWRK